MENNDYKVLIVDDDPLLLEMHSVYFEQCDMPVVTAEDGKSALEIIQQAPDEFGLIVSDVLMPVMDGYEFCEKLKADNSTADIPVIFVSALSDLNEKLVGYKAGADDYIRKPVDGKEIIEKAKVLIEKRKKQLNLSGIANDSREMAMTALSFSSELGEVINFYKNILESKDYGEVCGHVTSIFELYGLSFSLQIYTPDKVLYLSSGGANPLENEVIELARGEGRYFDFGSRTIINFKTFALLIKNMPIDDDDRYGRVKDQLAMIGNGLEAKILQLNNDVLIHKKDDIVLSIKDSLESITVSFSEVQAESIAAIEDMNDEIREKLMVLGLMEYQEEDIQEIVKKCLNKSNKAFYKGISIKEELESIYVQLRKIFDK